MSMNSNGRLIERLQQEMQNFTDSEKLIASFLLADRQRIPFETAASLAGKLNLNPSTIGRFCQRLGYRNFRAVKEALKFDILAAPWPSSERFASMTAGGVGTAELQKDLDLTVSALIEVYRMAASAEWEKIATLLADAPEVLVAGFQTERGIAAHFAHLLQYARADVRLVELGAGNFAEVLINSRPDRVLVIVDTRRYSKQAQMLAEHAQECGITLVYVTDKYCHWAAKLTPHVLALPTDSAMFWTTMVPTLAALVLLANAVVLKLGVAAEPRLERLSQLYQNFTGHVGPFPRSQPREID